MENQKTEPGKKKGEEPDADKVARSETADKKNRTFRQPGKIEVQK